MALPAPGSLADLGGHEHTQKILLMGDWQHLPERGYASSATGEMLEHLDLDSWHCRQLVVNSTQCRCSINMLNETGLEPLARLLNSTGECPVGVVGRGGC